MALKVIFEDNHILIVEKKAGMLTQPDNSQDISLEELSKEYVKEKYNKQGNVFLHAIHRLDKQVSGLVIFAKTSKALSRLNEEMKKKKITKKYVALVEGIVKIKKDILINYIFHGSHKAVITKENNPKAKRAELHYEVKEERNDTSLVEIDLITGRYHQIRAQLSYLGHPIVGDVKYSSKKSYKGIALHCFYLTLIHPVTKERMVFNSNISL